MNKYKVLAKLFSGLVAFPMCFFGYGLSRWIIGHWFLPWQVIGGGILTFALVGVSVYFAHKSEQFEKQQNSAEKIIIIKDNSNSVTPEKTATVVNENENANQPVIDTTTENVVVENAVVENASTTPQENVVENKDNSNSTQN